jgi:putative flippase GtrA
VGLIQNGFRAGRGLLDGFASERLSRYANTRFVRFMGVSAVALLTSLVTVAVCDGIFHMTSGPTAIISQVTGACVSYVLSRWAWERKGRPDVLRETIPFWIVFVIATLISWGFTKLGYSMAAWMHLHGLKSVLVVEAIYFIGNVVTFLMRFVIFHYILFADRKPKDVVAAAAVPAPTAEADVIAEAPSAEQITQSEISRS